MAGLLTPAALSGRGAGAVADCRRYELDRQFRHFRGFLFPLAGLAGRGGAAAIVRAPAQPVREKAAKRLHPDSRIVILISRDPAMAQPRYRLSRSIIYGYFPTGVKWLLIVNTAIFVHLVPRRSRQCRVDVAAGAGAAPGGLSLPAGSSTSCSPTCSCTAASGHLLFNMLALWMFGVPLEQTWGTRRFLKYYFLCGVGAGICDTVVNALLGTQHQHHRRFGRHLRAAAGVRRVVSRHPGADVFPVPHQGQVPGDDLRRRGVAAGFRQREQRRQQHRAPGRNAVRPGVPEGSAARRLVHLPDFGGRYRQWKMQRAKKKFQVYMRKHDGRGPWVN